MYYISLKNVLSLTLFTMRLPGDLWVNQMLLLALLAEEVEDDDNERFYNQLNGEGHHCCDCHLLQPYFAAAIHGDNSLDETVCRMS
jgi:hypothetical protein